MDRIILIGMEEYTSTIHLDTQEIITIMVKTRAITEIIMKIWEMKLIVPIILIIPTLLILRMEVVLSIQILHKAIRLHKKKCK
jgi:hypothetical protein